MVENIGGVVIVIAMFYMLYICVTQYGDVIGDKLVNSEGTWGNAFCCGYDRFLRKQYYSYAECRRLFP